MSFFSDFAASSSSFQCSSASRKFLNGRYVVTEHQNEQHFSALQRAENSSIGLYNALIAVEEHFSALQRAENSSIVVLQRY